jgi:hypothetical protein
VIAPAVDTFTPPGLTFDEAEHRYFLQGRQLLSVTGVLRSVGLIDGAFFSDADRARGVAVHRAIHAYHMSGALPLDPVVEPFFRAYLDFMTAHPLRVHACEELLASAVLQCAGTLDLRGVFEEPLARVPGAVIDLVDVKTGAVPEWVGYQTAGYARLLSERARLSVRRWCLHLTDGGRFTLHPLAKRNDERVFVAAVTVAQARKGWL